VKICAISDLHGQIPKSIPECDLLIVAGDICPDRFEGRLTAKKVPERQLNWFRNVFVPWVDAQPCEFAVSTWGNHDWCGQLERNAEYGKLSVVSDAPVMLNGVKLWLTPWSNQFFDWAFMKQHEDLEPIYAQIPEDVDILVSHQPPYGYGDLYDNIGNGKKDHVASQELLYHIERVRPSIVVCGHLHGGYGKYQHGETTIYNVSLLNDAYQMTHPITEFELGEPPQVIPWEVLRAQR